MTSRDFCYWLQGLFELGYYRTLSEEQVVVIRNHLNMVFYHEIDPSFPKEQQEELQHIHDANIKRDNTKYPLFNSELKRC